MKCGKQNVLAILMVICLLLGVSGSALAAGKVLELRNSTSRMIWVAKSNTSVSDYNSLQWYSQKPNVWAIWNVNEGGYLYYAFARQNDPGQREKIYYAQLPYHHHYRWFWKVVSNAGALQLTADYERAKGRNPMQ